MDVERHMIELAIRNVERGGRPFACVITRNGEIVAEAVNQVEETHDPTAHAEILAIREASQKLGSEVLAGCVIYNMAHSCPMCLGAIYYASPDKFVFLTTREKYSQHYSDARRYFTMDSLYQDFGKPWQERQLPMELRDDDAALEPFKRWRELHPSGVSGPTT